MRWFFILLVICNGIYFIWRVYLQPPQQEVSIAAMPLAQAGDRLELLKEKDNPPGVAAASEIASADSRPPATVAADDKPEPKPAVPTRPVCWQIGPFADLVSAKQVESRLAAMDIGLDLREVEMPGKTDYWVHIPPQPSRKLAIKLLRDLQSRKIDSFLITEGELENGISLGFFTEKPRADLIHEQRREQGYDAAIKEVVRVQKEFWAIYSIDQYGELHDSLWQKMAEGNTGLDRRKNYCDKIASP